MNKRIVLKNIKSEMDKLGEEIDKLNKGYDRLVFKHYLISCCSGNMRGTSIYDELIKLSENNEKQTQIIINIPKLTEEDTYALYNRYDMYKEFYSNNELKVIPFNILVFTRLCELLDIIIDVKDLDDIIQMNISNFKL